MRPETLIGRADADIFVLAKDGRDFRYERMMAGDEVPREFFYGFLDLAKVHSSAMVSTTGGAGGAVGRVADTVERGFSRLTGLGVKPLTARLDSRLLAQAKALLSFTDGYSLSLGLGFPRRPGGPVLLGGFHGLSDIEARSSRSARPLVRRAIARALAGLDHAFFFGPADRDVSIARYGLSRERTSLIRFGVDTAFWRPLDVERRPEVVAVGQDLNRDFDLLAAAPGRHPTRIVSRRNVNVPTGADHVSVTTGDFFGSDSMTDEDLRRLYNMATAIIVPLHDVNQPTGYSVTLQAMSCSRPVILTRIRGLWAPELLKDGENCLLVPPGDAEALSSAIALLRSDRALAERLGKAARATVEEHFSLDVIAGGTRELAELGLRLHQTAHG
ncbi:MAG: glycosyltransferase family 4 protein [Bacteroidales bacterium]|nr:glycosyltransferase family 4 protein [Bacteroidales bacterium]